MRYLSGSHFIRGLGLSALVRGRARRKAVALIAALAIVVPISFTYASIVLADAGNPILGTIQGTIVDYSGNPNDADTRVTVYVRGKWNWLSHNKDCNVDRNGTGVGLVWNDPTEPGFTVTKGAISAGVGIASLRAGDTVNVIDEMVHPSDRGNIPESLPGPAGQAFVDPVSRALTAANLALWRSGCGRVPITTVCAGNAVGDPCGSWGYEAALNDGFGQGFKHTYASRDDVTSVCVNFYDVHGSNAGFQAPNGLKEIDVNGNGDNSIQTNAFNVNDGANCIFFPRTKTQTGPTPGSVGDQSHTNQAINTAFHDVATVTGSGAAPGAGAPTGTVDFNLFKGADACAGSQVTGFPQNGVSRGTFSDATKSSTYTSKDYTSTTLGTYTWQVDFNGDAVYPAGTEACGSETVDIVEAVIKLTPQTEAEAAAMSCGGVTGSLDNPVGVCHKVHAEVFATKDGSTVFAPAPNGTLVTFTLLNNTAGAFFSTSTGATGGASTCLTTGGSLGPPPVAGGCDIYINTTTGSGHVDVHASTSFSLSNVIGTLSAETGVSGGTCGGQTSGCNSSNDAPKDYHKLPVTPKTAIEAKDDIRNLPSDATGSVHYFAYTNSTCTSLATGGDLGTFTVTNGNADSSNTLIVQPGTTRYFQAEYSGDNKYLPQKTTCDEVVQAGL